MSNDVHLYHSRSNKIEKAEVANTRRCIVRNTEGLKTPLSEARQDNINECAFGSISPRACNKNCIKSFGDLNSPDHAQRDTNESDNNISSCSTLDIVNKIDTITMQQLEKKINELTKSLQYSESSCLEIQQKLDECKDEKEMCLRRIEVLTAAHECRITEMHCVIAELTKKLRAKQDNTILEEQEPEGSEISYQEGSNCNSDINTTNPDLECEINPLDDSFGKEVINEDYGLFGDVDFKKLLIKNSENYNIHDRDNINKVQIEALQEEILQLKAQIAFLQSQVLDGTKHDVIVSSKETKENKFVEFLDCQKSPSSTEKLQFNVAQGEEELNNLNINHENELIKSAEQCHALCTPQKELPKLAERIKLNCVSKKLKDINIVEDYESDFPDRECFIATISGVKNDFENLQLQLDQLKLHNAMLNMNLDESKEHCDHLYLLCGKYESNAVALQIALNCSDRAIEAYDVMLALLESKFALVFDKSLATDDSRNAVENVARHLLDRLESEINICENSLGPWQNTYFGISKKHYIPWTSDDEKRLRHHVSKLKGTRATVQNTIVNLESPFGGFCKNSVNTSTTETDKKKIDTSERAINSLMYEVLQLREDNLMLRNKIEEFNQVSQFAAERNSCLVQDTLTQQTHNIHQKIDSKFNWQHNSMDVEIHDGKQLSAKQKYDTRIPTGTDLNKSKEVEYLLEQNKQKYEGRIRKLEKIVSDLKLLLTRQSTQEQNIQRHKFGDNSEKGFSRQHNNVPETTL